MTETVTQAPQNISVTENKTIIDRDARGRFLTGHNGGGRPKGSRNKLGEKFIADVYEEWQLSGPAALKKMASDDPSGFVRVVAGILPKEFEVQINSELFREAANYAEAFRMARDFAVEERPLIDVTPESDND